MIVAAQTVTAADEPQRNRSGTNVAIGRKMADELRACTTATSNPIVQSLMDSMNSRLAAQVPKGDSAFTLNVIEQDLFREVHGPIALPGGYIFVPAALFLAAQDEAEFAGMLAQAMAQSDLIEEDLSRLAARSYQMTDLMQGFLCTFKVPTNYLAEQRAIEHRADLRAVSLMARAGFDPNALVRYVQRVQVRRGPIAASFSTLPPVKKRIAYMRAEIAKLPTGPYPIRDGSRFTEAKEEVRRLLATAPR
jgi:predicted Zn-dependent protease